MKTVVSVRFRGGVKSYDFDPGELVLRSGTDVIVETGQGLAYATCVEGNREVDESSLVAPLSPVLRIATEADREVDRRCQEKEKEAFRVCEEKILQHGLDMKLVDVSCSFEGNKILFFFTSDGRVDFRELVKDLAGVFRARIELRQIGVRDEAKMLGGLGICGRPFCCSAFLDDFLPVSIKMAKTQNLSLNPTKISGTCGRLMCCLKYEQDAYEDAASRLPKPDSFVLTPDGTGNVVSVDYLRETARVALDDTVGQPKCYHNCELCVLRSGKGSREGIAIPRELPERYVKPVEHDSVMLPLYDASYPEEDDFREDSLPAENRTEEKEVRVRRSRGGRGHRGRGGVKKVSSHTEGSAVPKAPEKAPAPKNAEKPSAPKPPEKAPAAEGGEKRRHHRGGRRHHGGRSKTE